jgi:hypothetical protein
MRELVAESGNLTKWPLTVTLPAPSVSYYPQLVDPWLFSRKTMTTRVGEWTFSSFKERPQSLLRYLTIDYN